MKHITLSAEFEEQIRGTETGLALKDRSNIYLVNAIKTGRYETYLEIQNKEGTKIRNLKMVIKRGMQLIDARGFMYTPKAWTGSMFILNDGMLLKTTYTKRNEQIFDRDFIRADQ